jgi:hypothetical protein
LNINLVQTLENDFGSNLQNGTYTGVLGEIQNGVVDMYNSYGHLKSVDNYRHFLYTNVFGSSSVGILMRRQSIGVEINAFGLMAGINLEVYGLLLSAILLLMFIAMLNEKLQYEISERNSVWRIFGTFMPSNTREFKHEHGATRCMLMLTCGITVFLSVAYYESNLLQMLLISKPMPQVSVDDVAKSIASGDSQFYSLDLLLDLIDNSNLLDLNNAIKQRTMLAFDSSDIHTTIYRDNGILMEEIAIIHQYLSQLDPRECQNYAVLKLDEVATFFDALLIRKERRDILESLNVIVLERMDFVSKLIEKHELNEECRQHIYPSNIVEPTYQQLSMYTLSGAFALLMCLLSVSLLIFVVEVKLHKRIESPKQRVQMGKIATMLHSIEIADFHDEVNTEHLDAVLVKYFEFRDMLLKSRKELS